MTPLVLFLLAAQPPADLQRVHVLVAAEVSDPQLARMVTLDRQNFKEFLSDHLPADRVKVTEFTGAELTATNVLKAIKGLDVRPTDALVFYYSGHGSYRAAGAAGPAGDLHTLEFQYRPAKGEVSPEAITRKELKQAMLDKKAALTVLLTDCCSDHVEVPPPPDHKVVGRTRGAGDVRTEPTRLGRSLFLTARGVVDMTAAADGQVAVSDSAVGSYFTAALVRAADRQQKKPFDWPAFAQLVQSETERVYVEESKKPGMEELAKAVREKKLQRPATFELPATPTTYAVIALDNPTATPITLQVRWGNEADWSKPFKAQANKYSFLAAPQPAGEPPVTEFQVKVNGEVKVLQAKLVTREAKPTRPDDGNVYVLPGCTPAK